MGRRIVMSLTKAWCRSVARMPWPRTTCRSAVLKARYSNPIDRILLLSIIGLVWDRAEPGGYMSTSSHGWWL